MAPITTRAGPEGLPVQCSPCLTSLALRSTLRLSCSLDALKSSTTHSIPTLCANSLWITFLRRSRTSVLTCKWKMVLKNHWWEVVLRDLWLGQESPLPGKVEGAVVLEGAQGGPGMKATAEVQPHLHQEVGRRLGERTTLLLSLWGKCGRALSKLPDSGAG